ncbi:40S ribosomal protein S19-3-like protein [Tanacetum coccineum]
MKSCPEKFSTLAHLTAGVVGGAASSIKREPTEGYRTLIEISAAKVQKVRVTLHMVSQQNLHLAQSNNQLQVVRSKFNQGIVSSESMANVDGNVVHRPSSVRVLDIVLFQVDNSCGHGSQSLLELCTSDSKNISFPVTCVPVDCNFNYKKLKKIYLRGGLGVGAFQRIYRGSKRNESAPPHFCKASGGIVCHILQQLETMKIIDIDPKGVMVIMVATTESPTKLKKMLQTKFHKSFYIEMPDLETRERMANILLQEVKVDEEEKKKICQFLPYDSDGLVWVDLERVCIEAGMLGKYEGLSYLYKRL